MASAAVVAEAVAEEEHPVAGKWLKWLDLESMHGWWLRRKHFHASFMKDITEQIRLSEETHHHGELVVAIEAAMPSHVKSSAERALEVFGRLRVWETPHNTGVLLYIALDRHKIEIIADKGLKSAEHEWKAVCSGLELRFSEDQYQEGLTEAVIGLEAILAQYCAQEAGENGPNFLPDSPVML